MNKTKRMKVQRNVLQYQRTESGKGKQQGEFCLYFKKLDILRIN